MIQSSARLTRLLAVSEAITRSLDTQEVTDAIIAQVSDALEAEACSLLLKREDGDLLYFHSASGEVREMVKEITLQMGEGVAGLVAQTGTPLLVRDAATDPRVSSSIPERLGVPVRSVVCAPLRLDGHVLGSIEVLNPIGRPTFNEDDLAMLGSITNTLGLAIQNARRYSRLAHEVDGLTEALRMERTIVGNAENMQEVFRIVNRIAPTNVTVLITGETGTGKGLLARFIHDHSPRRNELFVEVNCAAIPDPLIESELFGHEKGAFTGATYARQGKFERAHMGTLYLDEIGDMSLQAQAKLLRAIEEQRFERVGSNETIGTDVRFIATTNTNLEDAVRRGAFRSDLYYRLCQIPLHLPPLRDRAEDVPLLAEYYLKQFCDQFGRDLMAVSPEARQGIATYRWPGNIRELKNVMKRVVLLAEGNTMLAEHLPFVKAEEAIPDEAGQRTLAAMERAHIARTLAATGGVKKAAAGELGISRSTLDRKIEQYGISVQKT